MAKGNEFAVREDELPFAGWSRGSMLALWMGYCAYTVIGVHSTWFIFGHDPLSVGIINGSLVSIDLWSFIHSLVFCGIGWCFPNNFWSVFAGGCLFEVVEMTIAWLQIIPNLEAVWKEEMANTVWDLWFNTLGFKLGTMALRKWILHKRKMAKCGKPQRGLTFETCAILLIVTTVGFSTLAFSGLMQKPK